MPGRSPDLRTPMAGEMPSRALGRSDFKFSPSIRLPLRGQCRNYRAPDNIFRVMHRVGNDNSALRRRAAIDNV
jgi:hypothetical protein